MTPKQIAELRALLAKATPGPWEADTTKSEGEYGLGPDAASGFDAATIEAPDGPGKWVTLFDSLNSNASLIEEEYDEDRHSAWDAVARVNAALIVAAINSLPALLDLAERATTARAEAIRDGHKQAREWVDKFDIPKARAEAIRECAKICAERAKLWEREAAKIERLTGKWVDLKALSEDSRINEDAILALLEKPHVPAK